MKFNLFGFLALLLIFSSCSSLEEKKLVVVEEKSQPVTFMSSKEIVSQFVAIQEAKQMEDSLTPEAIERIKNLPTDDQFITSKHLKELHAIISERQRESFNQKSIKAESAPRGIDRRNCDTKVVSQVGGVCTSHAISNAMDNLICKPKLFDASNMDLWDKYKKYSTWSGVKAATKYKICDDKFWSNGKKRTSSCSSNRHILLKKYAYLDNSIEKAKKSLDEGYPLVYSGKVTSSWGNCQTVIDPNSKASGGGHAVLINGYQDAPEVLGGGYFIIKNSWGKRCGSNGYQYLPYHYAMRTDNGMYGFFHSIKLVDSKYSDGTVDPVDPVDPVNPTPVDPVCKKVRNCKGWWIFKKCTPWKTVCK